MTHLLLSLLGCLEPPGPLLIHLGSRGDTVDGHEQQFSWADHCEKAVDVVEDAQEYVTLRSGEFRRRGRSQLVSRGARRKLPGAGARRGAGGGRGRAEPGGCALRSRSIFWMEAWVDDAVHVEV